MQHRYAGVLELVREKSGWGKEPSNKNRGVAAYFCHNSYAAHVVDVTMEGEQPRVERVCSALDCGIVVNPDAAANMVEGAVVDGIGNAMYGEMTFTKGAPTKIISASTGLSATMKRQNQLTCIL